MALLADEIADGDLRHLKVLLVEDDEDDYLITGDLLSEIEGTKFDLEWARDYDAAVEAIERQEHDIYLLDYRLGGHTGLELLREVTHRGSRTPAIILTGQGDREVDLASMEAGASDYLVKGMFDARILERSIRYAIERRKAEEDRFEAMQSFRGAFEDAATGMALVGTDGSWLQVNRALCDIVGYTEEEFLGLTFQDITHPDDLDVDLEHMQRVLAGEIRAYQMEKRYFHKDGSVIWILLSGSLVRNSAGEPLYFIAQIQDITPRKELERRLEHEATHDFLTGLVNRALFMENLERALSRANRREDSIAVLFLDLDGFKRVNDSLGHEAGDRLLIAAGQRLHVCLRTADTIARLGGDEFAILIEDVASPGQAEMVARRMVAELRKPFDLDGNEVSIGTSVGICVSTNASRPSDMLRDADTAMYQAKQDGKNRYRMFDPEAEPQDDAPDNR